MTGYDSWKESGAHDFDDEEIYLEEREIELLNNECDPSKAENILEALREGCLDAHQETLETAFINNDKQIIGTIVRSAVCIYWEDMAKKWAMDDWVNQ